MAFPTLTIRNFTTTPIEIKSLECSSKIGNAVDKIGDGIITSAFRVFVGILSNLLCLSTGRLERFSEHEFALPIGPFETRKAELRQNHPKEILRLTFEAAGTRYRINTPRQASQATILTPHSSDSTTLQFTAVHLAGASHISLFSSAKLESWMSQLDDDLPLSALSIPGTHNSPTCHRALPTVRCQAVGVREQLDNGVRFLDIRVQPESAGDPTDDGLILVHSAFPISLTGNKYFRALVNTIYDFLDANPRETVIISVKREGVGKATDQQLSRILRDFYVGERWFTENRIPSLGEARKRIVLIRRFALDDSLKAENGGTGWAIDAESWPDNCADGRCTSGEICVQDFYEVAQSGDIEKKITYSIEQLNRSAESSSPVATSGATRPTFFVNFLSASNFWNPKCWPDRVAAVVNPKIVDHLCRTYNEPPDGAADGVVGGNFCTGIVVCDWVGRNNDWILVRCVVGMNARLQIR